MLKKIVIGIVLLALTNSVRADIALIEPVQTTVGNNATVTLGSMQAGETVKVLVSRRILDHKWTGINVQMPRDWNVKTETQDQTFILYLSAPINARKDAHNVRVNVNDGSLHETVNILLNVKNDLLAISMENLIQEVYVGDKVQFRMRTHNTSLAPHALKIQSNLPHYWLPIKEITVQPNETQETILELDARLYGQRAFEFTVSSTLNGEIVKVYPAQLTIQPTLASKYNAVLNGFPFFNLSMIQYYFVNGFLSLAWAK